MNDFHRFAYKHRRWTNWYHFFSNKNPYMIALFPKLVEEDKKFRQWLKEGK